MRQRPKAHCLIVGRDEVSYGSPPKQGGTWRQVMLAEVGAQLPMDRVHFVGALPYQDYVRLLQVSTCHVYLTYPFVLSWSCLEAMSTGTVVLGSATAPVQEVIEHGVNGLQFDFFDVPALAEQAIAVMADRGRYAELGQRARQSVVQRFDLRERCLPELLTLLGEM